MVEKFMGESCLVRQYQVDFSVWNGVNWRRLDKQIAGVRIDQYLEIWNVHIYVCSGVRYFLL